MNKNRRKFLKMILIGSSAFVVGKALGPLFSMFMVEKKTPNRTKVAKASTIKAPITKLPVKGKIVEKKSTKKTKLAFQVVDGKEGLKVCDDTGEEIFHFDNEA